MQEDEFALQKAIDAAQAEVHRCLSDNLDTPGAMAALSDLIGATNRYLARQAAGRPLQPLLLRKAAAYVTRILSGKRRGLAPKASNVQLRGSLL